VLPYLSLLRKSRTGGRELWGVSPVKTGIAGRWTFQVGHTNRFLLIRNLDLDRLMVKCKAGLRKFVARLPFQLLRVPHGIIPSTIYNKSFCVLSKSGFWQAQRKVGALVDYTEKLHLSGVLKAMEIHANQRCTQMMCTWVSVLQIATFASSIFSNLGQLRHSHNRQLLQRFIILRVCPSWKRQLR